MKNFKTKLGLIAIVTFMLALMTTNRANAQFGLGNVLFDVQYNNQFDDSTEWINLGYTLFTVDTVSPYGSFVSSYMTGINSFTADNGFAMIDLDAQPTANYVQYGELALLNTVQVTGHDNYGIGFQSYFGAYDDYDSAFVKVTRERFGVVTDTLIQLHADIEPLTVSPLVENCFQDSTHYIDLSTFVETNDIITLSYVVVGSWGLAFMVDDLVVLAWNPTVVISGIEDCVGCVLNPNKKVVAVYNILGQPVNNTDTRGTYIRRFDDNTTDKITVR
jgi:hypothetical protein